MTVVLRAVTGLIICGSLAFLGYGAALLAAPDTGNPTRGLALAIVALSAASLGAGVVGFVCSFRRFTRSPLSPETGERGRG